MNLGVRGKLFAVSLLLLLPAGLASGLYAERTLRGWLDTRIEAELTRHAKTARTLIELLDPAEEISALDPLADRLGVSLETRITIINADGAVVGDSDLDEAQVASVENHGSRPEIREALASGIGISRRYSTTIDTSMLYVAVPYERRNGHGTVRASLALAEVDQAINRLRLGLLVAALVGLAAAIFMSGLASHLATRPVRGLVDTARAAAKGQRRRRLPVHSQDELGRLAGSFNRVVDELDTTMTELTEQRDYLETILDSLSEGVLALDAERHVTRCNRAALEMLGLDENIIGQPFVDQVRIPALVDLISQDPPSSAGEDVVRVGVREIQAHVAELQTGGCLLLLRDLTRAKRLEVIRRDFVANVSHELRTPVSVIKANAETLVSGALDDKENAQQFADAIFRNADRLSQLISDLLDLSRIEAGELGFDLSSVDVAAVAQRTIESLMDAAQAKNLRIELDVATGLRARADDRALGQVLSNLVDNAIKYASGGTAVVVRGRLQDSLIRLEVEDDGPGIDLAHRERVFERFYRVDAGRSRQMGGTGLGISIVKHLIDTMGGRVGLEAVKPHGVRFWVSLPAAA